MIISTDIVTSNPSFFFFLFFFFSLYFFFSSSSPACYAPYFSCTGTQPDKYCFTFSAILFGCTLPYCVLAYIACWPLDRRILHELYFACAATSRVPPALDKEVSSFGQRESTARFLSGPCLSLLRSPRSFHWRPAHGDFKLRAQKKKKKHQWHCMCFQGATSFPCFAMIGNGRVYRLLGTRRKVKLFRRKCSLHRTVLSLTREFAPSSRRRATNQCFLSSLDSGKLW